MTEQQGTVKQWLEMYPTRAADLLEELDDINGILGDDRLCPMSELTDSLSARDPYDAFLSGVYSYGIYSLLLPHNSARDHDIFDPTDDYYFIDSYGRVVSVAERVYPIYNSYVDSLLENMSKLHIPTDLQTALEKVKNNNGHQ